jgi:hypothetical protein
VEAHSLKITIKIIVYSFVVFLFCFGVGDIVVVLVEKGI